jgi:hypothetical protein
MKLILALFACLAGAAAVKRVADNDATYYPATNETCFKPTGNHDTELECEPGHLYGAPTVSPQPLRSSSPHAPIQPPMGAFPSPR